MKDDVPRRVDDSSPPDDEESSPEVTPSVANQVAGDVRGSVFQAAEIGEIAIAGRDLHLHYADGVQSRSRVRSGKVIDVCPYPGLASFRLEQARWLFGRDALIAELVGTLHQRLDSGGGLQMVVAPSGAGKSSLLRAGLLARLAEGAVPGSSRWPAVVLTPTADPVRTLLGQMASLAGLEPLPVDGPARVPDGFVPHLRAALPRSGGQQSRVVLVVDQFEELFTLCGEPAQRTAFIDVLAQLAEQEPGSPAVALVVVGVRADFFAACVDHPTLRAALRDRPLVVGPMSEDELREAILYPAQDVGLEIEPGLVELLLRDLGTTAEGEGQAYAADRLPLLAHALRGVWQQRQGTTLTVSGYESTGGIQRAVAITADRVFDDLGLLGQQAAQWVFLRLTKIGDGADDTRRRVARATLIESSSHPDVTAVVVDRFTRARLLTQRQHTVEITHEAMLNSWPRLRRWIDTDRAGRLTHQDLEDDAVAWDRDRANTSLLYRDSRLEVAQTWARQATDDDLSPVARAFLDASARQQRVRRTRSKVVTGALVLLAVIALVFGVTAVVQLGVADRQSRIALSRALAAQSVALRTKTPERSMLAAVAAWRTAPSAEARSSVLEAQTQQFAGRLTGHEDMVVEAEVNANGTRFATASRDGKVRLWDLKRRELVSTLEGHTNWVNGVAFDPRDPDTLVSASSDGTLRWWGRQAGVVPARGVTDLAFSPDGALIATGNTDGTVQLWDAVQRRQIGQLTGHEGEVSDVAFNTDGTSLASADNDGTARLWNVAERRLVRTFEGHTHYVDGVRFAGNKLITVSHDSTGIVWDLASDARTVLAGHVDAVSGLAITPDSRTVATTGYDSTTRLWDIATGRLLRVLNGHTGVVDGPVVTPDGSTLIVAGADRTVSLWDLRGSVYQHTDYVTAIAGAPDVMATGDREGVIRLWDTKRHLQTGSLNSSALKQVNGLAIHGDLLAAGGFAQHVQLWDFRQEKLISSVGGPGHGSMTTVAFSPDGRFLATGDHSGKARLWDVRTRREVTTFAGDNSPVTKITISADGRTLLMSGDIAARAFDLQTGRETAVLRGHTEPINGVAIHGNTLATAGNDTTIRLWDRETGAELAVLRGHTSRVDDIAFSPDGQLLVSVSWDATVRLWDVPSRTPLAVVNAHAQPLRAVRFLDDSTLATTSNDFTAMVWDTDPERAVQRVCAMVGRDLTRSEWAELSPESDYRPVCGG